MWRVQSSQLKSKGDVHEDKSDLEKLLHTGNGRTGDGQSLSLPGARRRARYSIG